jgi:prepilin-type N-terminal cleavage/methylation domain-containing protein
MDTAMTINKTAGTTIRGRQRGFSLVEVMIAIVVMTIGLLAVVASIATGLASTENAQEDLIARQKAREALESIYTARNSQQIPFGSINNVASGGIFLSGANPLYCAGPDGLVGTTDDVPCTTASGATCPNAGIECMVLPGPDGRLGTADDVIMSLGNFSRTITIGQVLLADGTVNQNLLSISVAITYQKTGLPPRTYTVSGLISQFH